MTAFQMLLCSDAEINLADAGGMQPVDEAEWWYVKTSNEPEMRYRHAFDVSQEHRAQPSWWYLTQLAIEA